MSAIKTTTFFTRKQYLMNECSHQEYYEQFCTPKVMASAERFCKRQFKNYRLSSTTGLPVPTLSTCDGFTMGVLRHDQEVNQMFKDRGDYITLAGGTCLLKAAVTKWRRENA